MKIINGCNEIQLCSLILMVSVVFAFFLGIHRYGDANTYYLMTESFLKDGDLVLDNQEVNRRYSEKFQNVPVGVYVFVDEKGAMKYAKPILYPLIALPFFFFLGIQGFSLLNGLLLGGSIVFSYLYLRKHLNWINSLCIASAFFFCSFIPVYAAWIHPEMVLFFACTLCMWLWLDKNKIALSALIIGIASSAKVTFLLLLIPLIAVLIFKKKFRDSFKTIGMSFLGISMMSFLTVLCFGQFSFYHKGIMGFIYSAVKYIIATQMPPYSGVVGIALIN